MTLRLGGDGAITGCTSLENPDLTVSGLTISGSFDAEKVLVASGTAAAPSYTFSGDTDNGLYYAGTNSIGVSTAGTSAIVVDSSQRVGIGTTSPDYELTIADTDGAVIQNLKSSTTEFCGIYFGDTDGVARGTIVYDNNTDVMTFRTNGSGEDMRIDSSGRLLVGTSTNIAPDGFASKIQTAGTDYQGGSLTIRRDQNTASGPALLLTKSRSTSVGGTTVVSNNDTLGIIRFYGADGTDVDSTGAQIVAEVDGTPGSNDMPGRLVFSTTADGASSPTERMRITSNGYLKASYDGNYVSDTGLSHEFHGDQPNYYTLHVRCDGASPASHYIQENKFNSSTPNNSSARFLQCRDATAVRMDILSNGGIANYQSNDSNLCDEREKKNIETLDSTWNCLKHWELKKFHYNEDADTDNKRYGVIAQQVEQYCPEVITDWTKQKAEDAVLDEDGNVVTPAKEEIVRMGVKEQQMYWMAIKALQEAQNRIEILEASNVALEQRLTDAGL